MSYTCGKTATNSGEGCAATPPASEPSIAAEPTTRNSASESRYALKDQEGVLYIYIYVCVCVCVCVCVYMYMYVCIYMYIHRKLCFSNIG